MSAQLDPDLLRTFVSPSSMRVASPPPPAGASHPIRRIDAGTTAGNPTGSGIVPARGARCAAHAGWRSDAGYARRL